MKKIVPIQFVDHALHGSIMEDLEYVGPHALNRKFPPGSAQWLSNVDGTPNSALDFICPCGCGTFHCISVSRNVKEPRGWIWDGNVEEPTLTPSIQCTTPCRWHGYLTAGEFRSC